MPIRGSRGRPAFSPGIMDIVRVRTAVEADVEAVASVHVESWRSTYRGLVPDEHLDGLSVDDRARMWRSAVLDDRADRGVFVLVDEDEVVGFCSYGPSGDDDAPSGTGEVAAIYLLESSWRRRGGSMLLSSAVEALAAAGSDRVTLWVLDGNQRARTFYEVSGWRPDGVVKVDDRGTFQLRELRYVRAL